VTLSTAAIRRLRGPKPSVSAERAVGAQWEEERGPDGVRAAYTVFLTGAECPFTCVFCDLWQHTLDGPTPPGALPTQLEQALDAGGAIPPGAAIKLYNASNFFDPRAVPPDDLPAIAALVRPFDRVVVECHPKLVGAPCRRFADLLSGSLEVAMGLETVEPGALARLNKGMTVEDFDGASRWLAEQGIGLRAFVLLGAPYVPVDATDAWAVASVRHAVEAGAAAVSLIPVRAGNGATQALAAAGDFREPTLSTLAAALARCLPSPRAVVAADTWDLGRFRSCAACDDRTIAAIHTMNATGRPAELEPCAACGN
jgi:radical SAM enzyme (TIGR01210 family)